MTDMNKLINDPQSWLVDVRTPEEVAEKGVEGADNIPLYDVPGHLDEFKETPAPVVLFCRSGNRSEQARIWLQKQGVKQVYNAGGIADVLTHKM